MWVIFLKEEMTIMQKPYVPIHHLPSIKLFRHLFGAETLKHVFQLIQDLRNKNLQGGCIWRKSV